jgi:hypothetical protein
MDTLRGSFGSSTFSGTVVTHSVIPNPDQFRHAISRKGNSMAERSCPINDPTCSHALS